MEPVTSVAKSGTRRTPIFQLAALGLGAAGIYLFGLALRYPLLAGIRLPRHSWARLA